MTDKPQCITSNCKRKADKVQFHGACCIYCYVGGTTHTKECDRAANK
jgi:hypothetical protein